ncbi:RDD family protein [Nesterenkonia natronophila]|uniref:RDD family protein n=1 Tax=Nesterenkonia natronophila TaxID=2174932 RepID=A0A3A4F003_9MICC|nr:RDD family protein [Nesterenkonia natronophila]
MSFPSVTQLFRACYKVFTQGPDVDCSVVSIKGPQDDGTSSGYPGDRLGLPPTGPGALAPWGRRILALFIDWGIASVVSMIWFDYNVWVTLAVFLVLHVALVGFFGVSVGKRLMRLQVVRLHPDRPAAVPGPHWALLRALLLLLVIPTVVISPDGRGAHDRIAGTVQVTM